MQREEGWHREKVEASQRAGNEESSEPGPGSGQRQTWLLLSGPWGPRAPVCSNYQLHEVEKARGLAFLPSPTGEGGDKENEPNNM